MKFLFLDIDGCLNYIMQPANTKPYPLSEFNEDCVKYVNEILEKTNAKLVITSDWRADKDLYNILSKVGFNDSFLNYDITPFLPYGRGVEISVYLNNYIKTHPYDKIEGYCIVDDESIALYEQKEHFVKCDGFTSGITKDVVEKVINILKQEEKYVKYCVNVLVKQNGFIKQVTSFYYNTYSESRERFQYQITECLNHYYSIKAKYDISVNNDYFNIRLTSSLNKDNIEITITHISLQDKYGTQFEA